MPNQVKYPPHNAIRIGDLAFPDDGYAPAASPKPPAYAGIAHHVLLKFRVPEGGTAFGLVSQATTFMAVPETTVDKYYGAVLR